MTGRERMERLIDGLPIDRVPISTLADDITRSQLDPEWRDIPILEFYRKLGYAESTAAISKDGVVLSKTIR